MIRYRQKRTRIKNKKKIRKNAGLRKESAAKQQNMIVGDCNEIS
jgi:hypothetical protein